MNDGLIHGLRNLVGDDLTIRYELYHLFKDFPYKDELYGNGFTMYCLLDRWNNQNDDLEAKIKAKYFDKIIVQIHSSRFNDPVNIRDLESLDYPPEKVAIIDGNDDNRIQTDLLKFGRYFKREHISSDGLYKGIEPISFGMPREKIAPLYLDKKKEKSIIIPAFGGKKTYSFDKEEAYYREYQESWFALTTKKGGWDCMRHYEIVANSCIPLFKDIDQCPAHTLSNWPKSTLVQILRDYPFRHHDITWKLDTVIHLYKHLIHNLTTESIAKYVLDTMG